MRGRFMFKRVGKSVAVLLGALVFVSGAWAEEIKVEAMSVKVLEEHYAVCTGDFDGYMRSIRLCVGNTLKEQDVYLNQLWVGLKAKLKERGENPAVFNALLDEQRKWLAFRDASCRFYYDMDGTIWRTVAASCRFEVMQARLKMLESYDESLTAL